MGKFTQSVLNVDLTEQTVKYYSSFLDESIAQAVYKSYNSSYTKELCGYSTYKFYKNINGVLGC